MISVKTNFKTEEFINLVEKNVREALASAAQTGLQGMIEETPSPTSTGALRKANTSRSDDKFAYFENERSYAPYVHLGTYKQTANPWIIRGVLKKSKEILQSWIRILKK